MAASASQADLQDAYGVFKQEAQALDPDYSPDTANVDGWPATRAALSELFPKIAAMIRPA